MEGRIFVLTTACFNSLLQLSVKINLFHERLMFIDLSPITSKNKRNILHNMQFDYIGHYLVGGLKAKEYCENIASIIMRKLSTFIETVIFFTIIFIYELM